MSVYSGIVVYDWSKLESQPLYTKGLRRTNKNYGYVIELAIDRSSDIDELRGESFKVYGPSIPDIPENTDVSITVDADNSKFMRQEYGDPNPYIVVKSIEVKADD